MAEGSRKTAYAIIVAAGKGTRMGTEVPKQLLSYGGSTVLETAAGAFARHPLIDRVIIVSPQDGSLDDRYREIAADLEETAGSAKGSVSVIRGGSERADSVMAGLGAASYYAGEDGASADDVIVLIHDAARPGVSDDIITRSVEAMENCEAVCTALPSTDSVRIVNCENTEYIGSLALKETITYPIMNTDVVRRELVFRVQTPQTFRLSDITRAYGVAASDGYTASDDAAVAGHAGIKVALIEGSPANNKLTTKEDIHMATRTGIGYDVHRFVPERPLVLCGTPIPGNLGLDGHSDADVAVHALMDALLGAAGLGDIGRHFPDTDDRYKGADSMKLLEEVKGMLGDARVINADITIIAQEPRLAPYIEQMKINLADTLGIPDSAVNVKATTEEGLGFTGRREGMAAMAVASIEGSF